MSFETLTCDIRFGIRMLLKNAGFTSVAVFLLTLSIGATTAIFSIVHAVLLRQLPFRDPQRLAILWMRVPGQDQTPFSLSDFLDYRDQNKSFEQIAAVANWSANLTGEGDAERVQGVKISANAFQLLGVQAAEGRTLLPDDDQPDHPKVAVISYGFWKRRFGGNPDSPGKAIRINGESYQIVGILPSDFVFPFFPADIASPLVPDADPRRLDRSSPSFLRGFGRLRLGISLGQAESQMNSLVQLLRQQYPRFNERKIGMRIMPMEELIVGNFRLILYLLFGAVSLVLVLACTNLASLVVSKVLARNREIAVRVAVGASRSRIATQLLTEHIMLSVLGGILGLSLAAIGVPQLLRLSPATLPRMNQVGIDGGVMAFAMLISMGAGIIFALVSALRAFRTNLNESLKQEGKGSTSGSGRSRTRSLLVVFEVAISLMLLIVTGLLLRSMMHIENVNPGFSADHLLTARLSLPQTRYKTLNDVLPFERRVQSQLESLAGVTSVGSTSNLPMSGLLGSVYFTIVGRPPANNKEVPFAFYRIVSPGYFQTMGVPLLSGRDFTDHDDAEAPGIAIINQTMAQKFWPGGNAVGSALTIHDANSLRQVQIVGIAKDVKHNGLDAKPGFEVFIPLKQTPQDTFPLLTMNQFWVLRSGSEPEALASEVRKVIRSTDPEVAADIKLMDDYLSTSLAPRRFSLLLLGIFAGAALLLTIVGIYGAMSNMVSQRSHEIGIRMALGSRRTQMGSLIILQGLKLAAAGVAIGLIGAFLATRLLSSLLFQVSAEDPLTYSGLVFGIILTAMLACCVPAIRAMRIDPMAVLRQQ
jgi:putative ABC transport system permease protein